MRDDASKTVLVVHGPGPANRVAALELADRFNGRAWSSAVIPSNVVPTNVQRADLVIGIGAKTAACRVAADTRAALIVDDAAGHNLIERVLDSRLSDVATRIVDIGVCNIDQQQMAIVQRAVVTARVAGTALSCTSGQGGRELVRPLHVSLDVPEVLPHAPWRDPAPHALRAPLLTTRTRTDSSVVFVFPRQTYVLCTVDGTDVVIHIDEHTHRYAKRVALSAHRSGLRVLELDRADVP
ncbi:MAG TPA: hypothetical protein VMM60_16190 [Ilumatobacter sp.]|nr:hypothetical protein [Ilumatobacter sp.]